jgi:hypothetical protein
MNWVEQEADSRKKLSVTDARAKELDKSREAGVPVVAAEAKKTLPFNSLRFQPVKSPGLYEAEFTQKGTELIFHFWPHGYHSAKRRDIAVPRFPKTFAEVLARIMLQEFSKTAEVSFDKEMGSFFVKVPHVGEKMFCRELAIAACEKLHLALGGDPKK